ncbi:MAG: hypothetical protein R6U13_14365, partial [Desulfatiglandaceae bacterium]
MSEYLYVGKNTPRTIEADKVTGKAIYIDDFKRPGMLYGKILYSRYAHAKIVHVDASKARALPGVKAVLTGEDIPDVRVGFIKDQRVLKMDKVRQFRDEVAAVAAVSPEIATEALGPARSLLNLCLLASVQKGVLADIRFAATGLYREEVDEAPLIFRDRTLELAMVGQQLPVAERTLTGHVRALLQHLRAAPGAHAPESYPVR